MTQLPALVVTLPGRSIGRLRDEVAEAETGGADLAEVRIDRLAPSDRDRLAELFPSSLPLIGTLRSAAEGGEGPDDPAERIALLDRVARLPFAWIDLEDQRDARFERSPEARRVHGVILSCHRRDAPPEPELRSWLSQVSPAHTVRKLVFPASLSTALELTPALLAARDHPGKVVHTTGESGPLYRAWAGSLGFALVYAALPERPGSPSRPGVEPSQLPVDRLRHSGARGATGPRFAVLGHPIGHTASPRIHSGWLAAENRPGLYLALDVANPGELAALLQLPPPLGFRGFNVTHPWKEVAMGLANRATPGALACGVANCLTVGGGEVEAHNTDLGAMRRRMEELRRSGDWDGRFVAVLGGGGAARATLAAAREGSIPASVFARRPEVSRELAETFGATVGRGDPEPASLVVHATHVGRDPESRLDLPLRALLGPSTYLLDWVYSAPSSPIASAASRVGCRYEDGARLLTYQAAASYERWWGSAVRGIACAE
jgi:shikimate dehydrogenase